MSQSRAQSLVEAVTNTVVGYAVAVSLQLVVFPSLGLEVPIATSLAIGAVFTAASILRSYALRRTFEVLRRRQAERS